MGNESDIKATAVSEPAEPRTAIVRPPLPPTVGMMVRCPVCGEPMAVTAMFCRRCGKVFIVNTATVLTGVLVVTSFFLTMIGVVLSILALGAGLLIKMIVS